MQPRAKKGTEKLTRGQAAERLHRLTRDITRRYAFRDWNKVCCYGVSISQSHILDILAEEGDLTMQDLARRMYKSVSTMTRVAGQLVRKGYVRRHQDATDLRVVHLTVTPQGKAILDAIHRDLVATQLAVLDRIPESDWASAFQLLEAIAAGALQWREPDCACD